MSYQSPDHPAEFPALRRVRRGALAYSDRAREALQALLEEKWPDKYNSLGHLNWTGRLYGRGATDMKSGIAAMAPRANMKIARPPIFRFVIKFLIRIHLSPEGAPHVSNQFLVT